MKQKKTHISLLLGIAALLMAASVILATGTAFARYRENQNADVVLNAQKPGKVLLWAGNNPETDYVPGEGVWESVDGEQVLNFMVTNTGSDGVSAAYDQSFRVRLVASLGAWDGASDFKVRLTITEQELSHIYYATVKPIKKDTALYREFGEGWYFTFLDNKDRELYFDLAGQERSTIQMQLTMENPAPTDPSLLKLQIVGQPDP